MNKVIITLIGPTCSGKTTLKDQMLATGNYIEVISHTTRPMRNGEVDGETYHFVTKEEFDGLEMLESVSYNGNTYGGSAAEFEKAFESGLIPVIIVEPNGNVQINTNARVKNWKVVNTWVGCPTELQAVRLITRLLENHSTDMHNGDGTTEKLIKEYTNRLVTIQNVENDWPRLFKESLHASPEVAPLHYVCDHIPHVITIPEFTADNEDEMRGRVEATVEMLRGQGRLKKGS